MNEQYNLLFQQYKAVNPLVTESEFQGYVDKYGDEYLAIVDEEIKKKVPLDPLLNGNQPSTDTIPTEITEQMNGLPMNQMDSRYEQGVTLPSDMQPQTSSESVSILQQPSMESGLPTGQSTSEENLINTENTSTNPASEDVGNLSIPKITIPKTVVTTPKVNLETPQTREDFLSILAGTQNLEDLLTPVENQNEPDISLEPVFDPEVAKVLDKDYQDAFVEIPKYTLGGLVKAEQNADITGASLGDNESYNRYIEGLQGQGKVEIATDANGEFVTTNGKYDYVITDEKYLNEINQQVEVLNAERKKEWQEKNTEAARYNLKNESVIEQTSFGEFMEQANKYGVIPTNEEYDRLVTEDARNEFLATSEAAFNAQKNNTTFQEEYDKAVSKYVVTDDQKINNGTQAYTTLLQALDGAKGDNTGELQMYNTYFRDQNNLKEFGEWWAKEGKAKYQSSFVREKQLYSEKNRNALLTDFLSFKNDKAGTNLQFLEEAIVSASAKADLYAQQGNQVAMQSEISKINSLEAEYQKNIDEQFKINDEFTQMSKRFESVQRQKKEEEELQVKVQNGDLGARAQNFLGQIPLAITTSAVAGIRSVGRIANTVIGSENLKDAIDVVGSTELRIGNVKVASLTDNVKVITGDDGFKYKQINGKTYGLREDGSIFRTTYQPNGREKVISEDTEYKPSGFAFLTAKTISDIYFTSFIGGGANAVIGSSASRIAASKNVSAVFGEGSQLAKQAASFAKLAKNADNVSVTGWFVQSYDDNYLMAEQGGITDPINKHLYAITQSAIMSVVQRINPDVNFLKSINSESRQVISALMTNKGAANKELVGQFLKKMGNNVVKETGEETVLQGLQDISNRIINNLTDTNLQVSDVSDYKELVAGTIVPSMFASLLGGKGNRLATVNNKEVDLTTMPRNELFTEMARDKNALTVVRDFKENAFFQSGKDEAQAIENEIKTRKKYIDKVPDSEKYDTEQIARVVPVMQELERKREQLKNDDGTFAETLNNEINSLTSQVNSILAGQPEVQNTQETPLQNEETAQPAQESETVQEQTTVAENEPEQVQTTANEESSITNEEQQPETTIESNEGAVATEQNILPDVEEDIELTEDEINNYISILNEAAQGNNTGTNGDVQLGTDSVQQQGQVQETTETADSTGGQENAEVSVQQNPAFSDNEQAQTLNTETLDQGKVLSANEKKTNNFIGLKNDYNRLSKAKKNQKEGKALLNRINQASRELGIPVGNAGDGKLSIKNPKTGKEMAKIRETVTEKTPSKQEIEFAKSHIPDLILWNGDASSQRWDTDISWADIRKGASDIEKGNVNSVPAKRLINEVNRQANDLGGFNFIAGGGKIVSREFASLQEIEDSKKAFPKGWEALDNLTDEELKQIYDERKKSEEEFYTNRALQDENTNVYEQGQDVQSESRNNGEATNSPEYQQLLKDRTAQEARVKSAKEKLDRVNKTTNNDFQADQENLFGERQTDGGMFDERADSNAARNVISEAKSEYDKSRAELTRINNAIRDFESGNTSGTGEINFQRTEPSAQSLPQPVLEGLIEKLKKPFKKAFKNLNVVYDWKSFAEKAKAMGIDNVDMQRMQVALDYRMSHTAPNGNDEISVSIDRLNELYPDDVYSEMGWHYYGDGDRNIDKKSHAKLRSLKGKPNAKVTVYRAVPKGVTEINSGDWVSINRDYAVGHGESVLDGEYDIISAEVNANQVYTDANSLNEQGVQFMHDTQGEIYGAVLPDGTIYLNPDRFNANTAIHEFTHLWEQIMPNAWKKGVELFKNTQTGKNIFNQLKEEGNYSNLNEDQLWSEALNTHLGNYGGENWQNIRAQSNMDKLRDWFRDFIAKIGEATGLNSYFGAPLTPETKLDRFTKGVMQDLLNGKALNPESGFEATEVPVVIKQMSDSDLETMLTDLGVIQQGKCA